MKNVSHHLTTRRPFRQRWVVGIKLILIALPLAIFGLWLLNPVALVQANPSMHIGRRESTANHDIMSVASWASPPGALAEHGRGDPPDGAFLAASPLASATQGIANANFVESWSTNEIDNTYSVAWGDIDGDGDLDLIVGNYFDPNLIYRNDGTGEFSPASESIGDRIGTTSLALGDMDRDGDLDLAIGNDAQVNQVYRNDGTGRFTLAWESIGDRYGTHSVAWGDMDGDGYLDLAFGNSRLNTNNGENQVYRNEGGKSFSLIWQSQDAAESPSVEWGDMDGDGDLDLVFANGQDSEVYRNEKGSDFVLAWDSNDDTKNTTSVAWGDMDGDNDLDLAVGNSGKIDPACDCYRHHANQVYRNDGGGKFSLAWESTGDLKSTWSVAWGDMDYDGDLDLAVGNDVHVNQVYRNDGSGSFSLAWESTNDIKSTLSVAWGDMDRDGDLDLAFGNFALQVNQVYRNESGGGFNSAWQSIDDAKNSTSVAWGDMDRDGDLDLAVGNENEVNQVYRYDGGEFSLAWESTGDLKPTRSVAWGDMDDDGDLDLAVGNYDEVNQIYRNDGEGSFTLAWESTDDLKLTESVAWGDMDNDGDLDLAVGNWNRQLNQVYRNDGDRQFNLAWESIDDPKHTSSVAWGDIDNDGDLDLVIGNSFGVDPSCGCVEGEVNQLYGNDGGGNFSLIWESTEEKKDTISVALGDMDGDGYLDLAVGNRWDVNQVYRNNGGSSFSLAWQSTGDTKYTKSVAWGDMDGDGRLDLAIGNLGEISEQIYRNEGEGRFRVVWESESNGISTSVAWADVDSDGDLDLAFGKENQVNQLFENLRQRETAMSNNAPYLTLTDPNPTANANFYASSTILNNTTIPITYTLFDKESDPVGFIRAYYSPNGGGQWFPATPAAGTETTNLATSAWPMGANHTFIWNAAADLIKNDNVVFRIEAHQSFTGLGPYQMPSVSAQSFPFRIEAAEWYAKVVDESDQAVEGALVSYQGQLITTEEQTPDQSNPAGLIRLNHATLGQSLVALSQVQEQSTARQAHDGWAYRTYLTNMTWGPNDDPQPFIIEDNGEQRLVVRQDSPLILFNIVVSVEWDADETYLATIEEAFYNASDYLYDVTDGQMAFGEVKIYDNAEYWSHADFQISTKNTVRPYAFIGGITSDDTAHSIRVGRFWSGNSGNLGDWNQPNGYRTLIHEFGHYALYLYDEYFIRTVDENGNFTGQQRAACTGSEMIGRDETPTNASIMYYQYKASELADSDRWTINCQNTEQARVNNEPDWQTILRKYSDQEGEPDWILNTPSSRGSVMAGPETFPRHLLPFPLIKIEDSGTSGPARQLTVLDPDGQPFPNALVALYTTPYSYTIAIDQGLTDPQGKLTIYGAVEGDTIRVASFDGALAAAQTVDERESYEVTLSLTDPSQRYASQTTSPYLELVPGSEGDTLSLKVHGVTAGNLPLIAIVIPGEGGGSPQSTSLAYSTSQSAYTGQVNFAGLGLGSGEAQVSGITGGQLLSINSDYNLFQVVNASENELTSEDGNMQWHIDAGSLPHNANAYGMIFPTGYVPKPLPEGKQLLGSAYGIRFSGATTELTKPGLLSMHYHPEVMGHPTDLAIYRWNPVTENWLLVGGQADQQHNSITAPVTQLGIYALGGNASEISKLYLPLILE